jgi:cytochrome c oxidase subunit 3
MWLFIISDTATFTACLFAYGFVRNATPNWPRPFHGITNVAVLTLILLTSSVTMIFAERYAEMGDKAKAFRWAMITALCGILFAALHIRKWIGRIGEGMTLFHNPWGTPLFSSWFS